MNNKDIKYRAVCPICGKAFDMRGEGFRDTDGKIVCADCYHKREVKIYGKK